MCVSGSSITVGRVRAPTAVSVSGEYRAPKKCRPDDHS